MGTDLTRLLTGPEIGALADIASLVSFVLTIIVLLSVSKIKSYYLFTARVPDLAAKLKRHASNLAGYMNDYESSIPQIRLELTKAQVVLESLHRKLNGHAKQSVAALLKSTRTWDRQPPDKDAVYNIYTNMSRVQLEIQDIREDLKWDR